MSYIYVITNQINGKQYIGKTNDSIEKRWKEHIHDSKRRNLIEKRPLYSAMNKYGIENFTVEQIEECPYETANEREQYWIKKLDTYSNGYNATIGGDGKILYDYKEIANDYLELGTVRATARYVGCDTDTVRKACVNCGIKILTPQEHMKKTKSKPVVMIDKTTNEIIQTFPSMMEANRQTGISHGSISRVCHGKGETAGGYGWKFV